jgi:hypothetical protein
MSTRLISSIAILEGLVLLALSLGEIRRERQGSQELKAAHQLSADISDQFAKSAKQRGQLFRTSPDVLEGHYDVGWREMPWWIVWGVGAALFVAGVIGSLRSWKRASWFHDFNCLAAANRRFPVYLLLFGMGIFAVCVRINLERGSAAPGQSPVTAKILDLISKLPPLPRTIALHWYSQTVEGVSSIKVPYNPVGGPWMTLEKAIGGFAQSNGIVIIRFESAGTGDSYVCVWNKDASAMRKFVRRMGQGANKTGAANGRQPIRSETNSASSAAGSRH